MERASDSEIWGHAERTGAALLTKDEDFATRIALNPAGPAIVWVRIGNTTRQALLQRIEPLLPAIEAAVAAGEKLVEVI